MLHRRLPKTFAAIGALLVAMAGDALAQTQAAGAATCGAEGDAAFEEGLAAADARGFEQAARAFASAASRRPRCPRPELWYNLGLAQSQLPGFEVQAIASLKTYLLMRPDAANAAAVRRQITALTVSYEKRVSGVLDILEAAAPRHPGLPRNSQDSRMIEWTQGLAAIEGRRDEAAKLLAAARVFMGQRDRAFRLLPLLQGPDWFQETQPGDYYHDMWDVVAAAFESDAQAASRLAYKDDTPRADALYWRWERDSLRNVAAAKFNIAEACAARLSGNNAALDAIITAMKDTNLATSQSSLLDAVRLLVSLNRTAEAQTIAASASGEYKQHVADALAGKQPDLCFDEASWYSSGKLTFLQSIASEGWARDAERVDTDLNAILTLRSAQLASSNTSERLAALNEAVRLIYRQARTYRKVRGPY